MTLQTSCHFNYQPIQVNSCVSDPNCLHLFELAVSMKIIVEIGSWHGKSTHALLSGNRFSKMNGTVYAVDHFQGSADKNDQTHGKSSKEEFIENCGHFPNLVHLEMSSVEASKTFEDNSVDMVYIDGGHRYEDVIEDLRCWYPKVRILLCGHDFTMTNVRKAIEDFGIQCNVPLGEMHWEHFKNTS